MRFEKLATLKYKEGISLIFVVIGTSLTQNVITVDLRSKRETRV